MSAEPARTRRASSLTWRASIAMLIVIGVGGLIVSLAAFAYGRKAAQDAYDRVLIGAGHDIASTVTTEGAALRVNVPVSAFELLSLAPEDRVVYAVFGTEGQLLTGDARVPVPDGREALSTFDAELDGEAARFVSISKRFAERTVSGTAHIVVGQTTRARADMALDLTRRALVVLALTSAVVALLAVFTMRAAFRPLSRIGAALGRRDRYDLTPIDMEVPREAQGMLDALNSFVGRLDRQVGQMKNLIGDAAHQLRTPVTAIRAQAEMAADLPPGEEREAVVQRIVERTRGLNRLLDQMLSRALVIHRADTVPRERLDLRDIALDVFETSDLELFTAAGSVALDVPEDPVWTAADRLSLVEAAKNLLNNAVAHGTPPVTIGADHGDEGARLWVRDRGEGPPREALGTLGRRFVRGGNSGAKGSGLGLAIAQAVAESHGGALVLTARDDGFWAEIRLPQTAEVQE